MPMLGVMRLILDSDEGSASGEDDFFSVARTIPLVAVIGEVSKTTCHGIHRRTRGACL